MGKLILDYRSERVMADRNGRWWMFVPNVALIVGLSLLFFDKFAHGFFLFLIFGDYSEEVSTYGSIVLFALGMIFGVLAAWQGRHTSVGGRALVSALLNLVTLMYRLLHSRPW
jgi:ABC-type sulfate transport system permease subunit